MSWEMCPQAEMNVQRHHMGKTCWRGFIWCFQTALGSVLQEPFRFSFSFLCFKTHGFLLKCPAKRKSKSKLQMNYAIIFSSLSLFSPSFSQLPLSYTTHTHTHTHTHIFWRLTFHFCVCIYIDNCHSQQSGFVKSYTWIWDHKLY